MIIDSKEIAALKDLLDFQKVVYEVKPLPNCADIQLGKILVQRKTMQDLFGAIMDKRLWRQASELNDLRKQDGIVPVFVIEGTKLFGYNPAKKRKQTSSAIKALKFSFGIPVHTTKNKEDTIELLKSLDNKESKPFTLNAKPRMKSEDEQLQYLVEGVAGIGPVTAKKILANHRSEILIFLNNMLSYKAE